MPEALANPADRLMTIRGLIARFTQQEDLNFLLTNRIPRAAVTRFMGWFSKIENPFVRDASIACWRLFSDLDLSEAKKTEFKSLHDCFTRELRPGLRPANPDPNLVVSPSDGIIGAFGKIADTELFQIKGAPYSLLDLLGDPALVESHRNGRFLTLRLTSSMYHRFHAPYDGKIADTELFQIKGAPYSLLDLLGDPALVESHRNGCFLTLRLTSSMYHRFHAPYDGKIERVTFIHGDVWNVNPIALKRVEQLFCKNERAVLEMRLPSGEALTLVPVAAILVASIRLHFLDVTLNAQSKGPTVFPCDANVRKGDELGWFEHGSTIIVLTPEHFEFADNVVEGGRIHAGEPLLRKP